MQKFLAYSGLFSAGLFLTASPLLAASTTISSASTTKQSIGSAGGDTLTVTSSGTLTVAGANIAVTFLAGTSTLNNSGTISTTDTATADKARALRNNVAGATITINNNASGTITAAAADVFQMNVAGSTVTLNNSGAITANGSGNQAVNWNYGVQANGTVASSSNVLNNYAGGTITSFQADAVRLNAGATLSNSGTIRSTGGASDVSSSDGIDLQVNNTGVRITNDAGLGTGGANLIQGERHGITGGQDVDTHNTSTYDKAFTLSVTNNAGGTIQGDNGSGINIDGVDATEVVTVVNAGRITGNGVTRDGDGIDVDGVLNLTNSGTILSKNSFTTTGTETSEGVTAGGGTITNTGTIEGSVAAGNTSAVGRGITFAGIDHTLNSGVETNIASQKIYAAAVVNNSGLIKGDTDAGIAIGGSATSGTNYNVSITNNATGVIEGNSSTVAAIDGSQAVGGVTSPLASTNNETIINYGTIQQDGTGKAISLGSGTNDVQILGGGASINGDISGGTSAGANTLEIDPTSGKSFTYSHSLSNFNSVTLKSGTITLSGASTYTGKTSISGGTTYINNKSGSGTGTGAVSVNTGATLGGSGTIQSGQGNGVSLAAGSFLISGGVQTGTTAGHGLTLDNTVSKSTILDASAGNITLTFYLGAGTTTGSGANSFGTPNTNSTFLTILDDGGADAANELKFASNDIIAVNDLTNGNLQLTSNVPYLLVQAGSNVDYFGLTTTGDINGLTHQNGYVTNLTLSGDVTSKYTGAQLYLQDGNLEIVPEPTTTSMMLFTLLGAAGFAWKRRKSQKA